MPVPDPDLLAQQAENLNSLQPDDRSDRSDRSQKLPPLEKWNPPLSGEMDMRITRDGAWYHEGGIIGREGLVRLFSTILRREQDGCYYLVTPVEKWRIQVDDAPFVAILLDVINEGETDRQALVFQTNTGEHLTAGPAHIIEVEYRDSDEPAPYVQVRGNLRALISRAVFIQLADLAVEGVTNQSEPCLGVWSQGVFFPLGPLDE